MTAKPELILHIGMGKTGTTALQEAFWKNRHVLAQAGICYPDIGVVSGAHHKISPFIPGDLAKSDWVFLKPKEWAPSLAKSGEQRIVMSSELIAWSTQRAASAFCSALRAHFDLKICLYLRRQDNIIMAAYNQRIKAGAQRRTIGETLETLMKGYDYARTIRVWDKAAGAQNLIVRPYEQSQFAQGDLITDFFTGVLGMALPADFVRPTKSNSNPRFAPVALEYKRLINCVSKDGKASSAYNEALIAHSQERDETSTAVFHEQGLLSRDQRRKILSHFAAANAEIAQRFLGRDTLFTEPLADEATEAPAVSEQDLRDLSAWLKGEHHGLFEALCKAVDEALGHEQPEVALAARTLQGSFDPPVNDQVQKPKPAAGPRTLRRVIVHPGLPKTGTTAIQEAFFKNRQRLLRDHGILYPGIDENHTKPVLALFRADALNNLRFSGMSQSQLADYRKNALAQLESELRRDDWHTLFISGEGIATLDVAGWEKFQNWLMQMRLPAVEVIFGVRDGIDLVRSSIQQNIKSGMLLEDQYANPPLPGIRARITPALTVLGRSNVAVWDFNAARQAPQGLLHHFCTAMQLAPEVCALIAGTRVFQNESLSQTGVDALAERNRKLDHPQGISAAEHELFLSMKGQSFALPSEVIEKVKAAAAADEEWLGAVFRRGGAAAARPVLPLSLSAGSQGQDAGNLLDLPQAGGFDAERAADGADAQVTAKPNLVLHVGMDKTGTTAIQNALEEAHDRLKSEFRVLVPRTGIWHDFSHHPFAFTAMGTNGFSTEGLDGLFDRLRAEISDAGCNRVLITSECLFKLPIKPGIHLFWPRLQQIFGTVSVIVYVRRQDKWIDSRYRHSVISGVEIPIEHLVLPRHSDYLQYIDRWADIVGAENVRVRVYEREQFPYGDIAADFERAIDLPNGCLSSHREIRKNVSRSFEAIMLRAIFNDLQLRPSFYGPLTQILEDAVRGGPAERSFVSPELARQLSDRYEEANRKIAIKYLGRKDGKLFFDPLPNPATAYLAPAMTRARVMEILGNIKKSNPSVLLMAGKATGNLRIAEITPPELAAVAGDFVSALRDMGLSSGITADGADDQGALSWTDKLRYEVAIRWGFRNYYALLLLWLFQAARRRAVSKAKRHLKPGFLRARSGAAAIKRFLRRNWTAGKGLTGIVDQSAAAKSAGRTSGARSADLMIHFGAIKTGSTSIQRTLFDHANSLVNCTYLDAGLSNLSLIMSTAVQTAEQVQNTRAANTGLEQLRIMRDAARAQLSGALADAAARSNRVLISAEIISGFSQSELEELRRLLLPAARDIRFMGYVRDPVSLMQSVFQERLKNRIPAGFSLERSIFNGPPKIYRFVDRLDEVFTPSAVTVYPFDPSIFPDGDVVRHFLNAVDVRGIGLETERDNDSLSALAVKALFCFRRLAHSAEPAGYDLSREAFIADLRYLRGPSFAFHPDVQRRIRARSADWDRWAERRLGRPLAYLGRAVETGIRTEADLMQFSGDELSEIARYGARHGFNDISAGSDAEAVAGLIKRIRDRFAQGQVGSRG